MSVLHGSLLEAADQEMFPAAPSSTVSTAPTSFLGSSSFGKELNTARRVEIGKEQFLALKGQADDGELAMAKLDVEDAEQDLAKARNGKNLYSRGKRG